MNEVRVSSPYHSECVIGGTPAANDRVKKVLKYFSSIICLVLNICIVYKNVLY
jgi:hypothetical protein